MSARRPRVRDHHRSAEGAGKAIAREDVRLEEARERTAHWRRRGPYLSERQWGTVREDYSPHGMAWDAFPQSHARSRAYRWGEDGLAGISDNHQRLCFSVALWNGRDPILKERLFGLTNSEGNHGEDVKEYYFYLDSTPTHSYMKYLYKYPQATFPYARLVEETRGRDRGTPEYELINTGVFDEDRYFDVLVEYAKATTEDILVRISVANRGPEAAALHVLPTLWFRNTWSWGPAGKRPRLRAADSSAGTAVIEADHESLGRRWLAAEGSPDLLLGIFVPGPDGRRPVHGAVEKFQRDPYWRELVTFYEHFHGDTGAGLGTSHQTGWTALVANLFHDLGREPHRE